MSAPTLAPGPHCRRGLASWPFAEPCGRQWGHGGSRSSWVVGSRNGSKRPDLESYRNADPRRDRGRARASSGIKRYALFRVGVREDYLFLCGDRFVESMRYVRTYPTELPGPPADLLLGDTDARPGYRRRAEDPAVPPVNAEFLHERLPNSKLDVIDAGHFTSGGGRGRLLGARHRWWNGGYATSGSAATR